MVAEKIVETHEGVPYVSREAYQGRASDAVDALVLERLERRCNELEGGVKILTGAVAELNAGMRGLEGQLVELIKHVTELARIVGDQGEALRNYDGWFSGRLDGSS